MKGMRFPVNKKIIAVIIFGCACVVIAFQAIQINKSAQNALAEERARLTEQNRIPFEKKTLAPHLTNYVQILQNTQDARDLVRFRDSYFAATGGGLAQFSDDGKLVRHLTVLDGLPESDLMALAVYQGKLFIGTRTKNLVAFEGERFENYVWTNRKTQAVTALLEIGGRLLIGTFEGGLIEFDGREFAEIKAEKTSVRRINCLYKDGSARLLIGTFDSGLWISESGVWSHYTTAEGLPSNRIVGIAIKNENLYVATDFGLAQRMPENSFRSVAVLPSLSGLISHDDKLFLTKASGEIFTFDETVKEFSVAEKAKAAAAARFAVSEEKLFLLSDRGVFEIAGAKIKRFAESGKNELTDNFVSALAFDRRKANLWVGTFRRGIDILSADGKKLKHLESEAVREINYLEPVGELMSSATSGGLLKLKSDFSAENLTKNEGLPTNSVTHFAGDYIATAKGLAFRENEKIRVLSTVQGLPNNSVYAVLRTGEKLYAGTLGGLAEIFGKRVTRVFKDSNSKLETNWVTALCRTTTAAAAAGERFFIGTYGGGVFELTPAGEIRSFASEAGKFTVNPNAIYTDGERLYVGTLTGARVLDLKTQKWTILEGVLPSETVMSIAGDDASVYFGTTSGIARIDKEYFANVEDR